ncbi:YeeE/YedE family protein [Limosilactobacillus oris F0423]|uniref:YeeE/YedE family protein n=2 Tax=Limosilactobacillus oris TaxID=1632 RepID=A0ABN0D6R2_9LACO|nr:YeeE/YedE family protein [Limosilactobacillus oris F0423]
MGKDRSMDIKANTHVDIQKQQPKVRFPKAWRVTWSPLRVTVMLGVLAAYYFGLTGTFWAVTGEFTRWGADIMKLFGVNTGKFQYLKLIHYQGTVLTRIDGVMILGMFLGAFGAAYISNNLKWRLPMSWVRVGQALIGGMLAGFGARLAMGCNLAAFFTGIPQFSLHAWIFAVFMAAGTFVGTKIIRLPLFRTRARLVKNNNGISKYHDIGKVSKNVQEIHTVMFIIAIILTILLLIHSFAITTVLGLTVLFGLAFGFLLEKGQICFTSGFRDLWNFGRTLMLDSILAGMAISSVGTLVFIMLGRTPKIFWAGPNVIIGGFLFGMGIVIAGGCETGWMYRAMEGQVHFMLVGVGNVIGSMLLVFVWNSWAPVLAYKYPKVNLLQIFGNFGGLVVTFLLLGICYLLGQVWKRHVLKKSL